jgi:DNA-binding CsgD family transcriptional regulator
VHAGEHWLEKRSVSLALERLLKREDAMRQIAGLLTPREIEILRMVADGLRNKEITERLYISEGTVKVHLHNIYEKLKVNSRLQLARYAHTTAMHLLRAANDINMVSYWLGHTDINTTHIYLEIDMEMKRRMLQKTEPPTVKKPLPWQKPDVLHWLNTLTKTSQLCAVKY